MKAKWPGLREELAGSVKTVVEADRGSVVLNARRMSVVMWGLCVLLVVPTLVLIAIGPGMVPPSDIFAGVGGVAFLVLGLTFASVGVVVAARVPENRIGWIFCLTGFASCFQLFTWNYADVGLHAHALPGANAATVFNTVIGEATAGLLGLSLLLFPDGRLPSRRWRLALWSLLGGMFLLVVAGTFHPGRYAQPFVSQSNPLALPGVRRGAMNAVDLSGWLLVLGGLVLGTAALVVRLRRARGVERQQLKLVVAVGALAGIATAALMTGWLTSPGGGVTPHSPGLPGIAAIGFILTTFPLAAGVAILRYRLYDIDLVIHRTLVYGVLTASLSVTYLGFVLLFQFVLRPLTGGSAYAVALSTLTVALLFRPVRGRVQALVDRRLYRQKYDAQQTLEAFAKRLRNQLDLDALPAELVAVVTQAMQPAHASLWISPGSPRQSR
jgi:hypothetical protein